MQEINVRFEDKFLQIKSAVRLPVCSLFSELRDIIIDKLRRANEEIGLGSLSDISLAIMI